MKEELINLPILLIRESRQGKVKWLVQGHAAIKWKRLFFKTGNQVLEADVFKHHLELQIIVEL